MTDYNDLLTSGWAEVPEEKVLPVGHWRLENTGVFFNPGKVKDDGTTGSPRFSFRYRPISPHGDVNKKEQAALNGYDYSQNEIYNKDTFWLSSAKDKRVLVAHLQKHAGFTLDEGTPLTVTGENGEQVMNPAVREALRGTQIDAVLGLDEYKGVERNNASSFTAISD